MREKYFNKWYLELIKYKEEYGDCLVPKCYKTPDGKNLGSLVNRVRNQDVILSEIQLDMLNEIGFVWKIKTRRNFEQWYVLLKEYVREHKNCNVKVSYITRDGAQLGKWISLVRAGKFMLTDENVKQLNDLGFIWSIKKRRGFLYWYEQLKEYKMKNGSCDMKISYIDKNGAKLGKWASRVKNGKVRLTAKQISMLNELGFSWKRQNTFNDWYILLTQYKNEFGNLLVPTRYKTKKGDALGRWVNNIRTYKDDLSDIERKMLDEIGFVWIVKIHLTFDEWFKLLVKYKEKYGTCEVLARQKTDDGFELGSWVSRVRSGRIKINVAQKQMLDEIGFVWKVRKNKRK